MIGLERQGFAAELEGARMRLFEQIQNNANKVLLPEPLEPTMAITSPGCAVKDTPRSTSRSP